MSNQEEQYKPETFRSFENFVRKISNVPKSEVDTLEKERKKQKKQAEEKPAD